MRVPMPASFRGRVATWDGTAAPTKLGRNQGGDLFFVGELVDALSDAVRNSSVERGTRPNRPTEPAGDDGSLRVAPADT